jgi:hypothetical protein
VVEGREGLFIGEGVLRIGQEIVGIKSRGRSYYGEIPTRDFRPEVRDDRGPTCQRYEGGEKIPVRGCFLLGRGPVLASGRNVSPRPFTPFLFLFSFSFPVFLL